MKHSIQELLGGTGPVLFDGALGTELERRGFAAPLPLWTGDAAERAPELLRAVHSEALQAGADILTASTFRTSRWTLAKVGRAADATRLTRASVAAARAVCAAAGRGFVAGSMAPLEDCFHPERVPVDAVLRDEHARHAIALTESGADLILVETMGTLREARAAALAALETGLPVVVSLLPSPVEHRRLFSGEDLATAMAEMRGLVTGGGVRIAGFMVNCAPPQTTLDALAHTQTGDARPFGAAANAGTPGETGGWEPGGVTPEAFAAWAIAACARGARLLGGCCGTTPEHMAALAHAVRQPPPPAT